jgi:hypothetical protein
LSNEELNSQFDVKVRTRLHYASAVHKILGTYPRAYHSLSTGYLNTPKGIDFCLQPIENIARQAKEMKV